MAIVVRVLTGYPLALWIGEVGSCLLTIDPATTLERCTVADDDAGRNHVADA